MSFAYGIAAAIADPLGSTIGLTIWDQHWKGSAFALNMYASGVASIGFAAMSFFTLSGDDDDDDDDDELFPMEIHNAKQAVVGYLGLSAVIGVIIGDFAWLDGLNILGARKVILIDSLQPFVAVIFGWVFLGEKVHPGAFGGLCMTGVGVLLVSMEKQKSVGSYAENHGEKEAADSAKTVLSLDDTVQGNPPLQDSAQSIEESDSNESISATLSDYEDQGVIRIDMPQVANEIIIITTT